MKLLGDFRPFRSVLIGHFARHCFRRGDFGLWNWSMSHALCWLSKSKQTASNQKLYIFWFACSFRGTSYSCKKGIRTNLKKFLLGLRLCHFHGLVRPLRIIKDWRLPSSNLWNAWTWAIQKEDPIYTLIIFDNDIQYIMIYYDILWYIMIYYDILWYIMNYYDILWYIMIYYDCHLWMNCYWWFHGWIMHVLEWLW